MSNNIFYLNILSNILFIVTISTILLTVIFRLFNHNKKIRRENIGLLITGALITYITDILLLKIVLWSILLSLLIIIIVKKK